MRNVKELIVFGLSLHMAFDEAKANDGVTDAKDLPLLIPPVMKLPAAVEGLDQVKKEWEEASAEQRAQLKAEIAAEYNLKDDNLEEVVESAIDIAIDMGRLSAAVQKLKKPA